MNNAIVLFFSKLLKLSEWANKKGSQLVNLFDENKLCAIVKPLKYPGEDYDAISEKSLYILSPRYFLNIARFPFFDNICK